MILVFSSSMSGSDLQNDILVDQLKRGGQNYVFINPLIIDDIARLEVYEKKTGVVLVVDGKEVVPNVIYTARRIREDCLINLPGGCLYPTLLRQKIGSFLNELFQSFPSVRWLPGSPQDVERSDSKIFTLNTARHYGLTVPESTINSFRNRGNLLSYRKVLGFPFSITLNQNEREEVAVTLMNGRVNQYEDQGLNGLPWQWQSLVKSTHQIRCTVIGSRIHVYKADSRQFGELSFREAQADNVKIVWEKSTLPSDILEHLMLMVRSLGLSICCPEFLIDENGQYVFIDLNPCGDWFGFLDDEENNLVVQEIVEMLQT